MKEIKRNAEITDNFTKRKKFLSINHEQWHCLFHYFNSFILLSHHKFRKSFYNYQKEIEKKRKWFKTTIVICLQVSLADLSELFTQETLTYTHTHRT